MQDEPESAVPEEAQVALSEPEEQPTPFVYPKQFTTEVGLVINLPLPMCGLETQIYEKFGEMIIAVPGLGDVINKALEMNLVPGKARDAARNILQVAEIAKAKVAEVQPDDPIVLDILGLVSGFLVKVPGHLIALMALVAGLTDEEAGEQLTFFGDGTRLISLFVCLQGARFSKSTQQINEDLGMSIPVTLSDVAAAQDPAAVPPSEKRSEQSQSGGLMGEAGS